MLQTRSSRHLLLLRQSSVKYLSAVKRQNKTSTTTRKHFIGSFTVQDYILQINDNTDDIGLFVHRDLKYIPKCIKICSVKGRVPFH